MNREGGMTLVEILVAIALFAILLGGLGPLMVSQVRQAGLNVSRNRLTVVANNVLERYHALPPEAFPPLVGTRRETVVVETRPGESLWVQVDIQPADTQSYEIHVRVQSSRDPRLAVDAWSLKRREAP